MTPPDIRAFYTAVGVQLPAWSTIEAPTRCFANPDAHRRGDRDPSCSVNLQHGAWHCHACGAAGGAFDAATALGYTDRAAIDLMVAHGLTERRADRPGKGQTRQRPAPVARKPAGHPPTRLQTTNDEIDGWHAALTVDTDLIAKLTRDRGWFYATMLELQLGVDRGRITIPVRDDERRLIGLLRYQPWPSPGEPKMLAIAGSRRTLLPHPAAEPSASILLVEGEPDLIAARSHGLPAIAVPGVDGWKPGWARLLAGREVTVVMDCDEHGRAAAARIRGDLSPASDVRVLDLAPDRDDGYDLTDCILECRRSRVRGASLVQALVRGTVGRDSDYMAYNRSPRE